MAIPKLTGAPAPLGLSNASAEAAQSSAAMQAQATQQASAMILSSLQAAMELRARRDAQLRDIAAQRDLEAMRQTNETQRQAAQITAANERAQMAERGAMQRAQLGERGANQRARMQERGQNVRSVRSMRQNERQFGEQMGFQRDQAAETRRQFDLTFGAQQETSRLLNDQRAFELKQAHEAQLAKDRLDQLRSMAIEGIGAGLLEPGPIPGSMVPNMGNIQQFIQARQAPGGPPILPTPSEDAAGSPGAAFQLAELLQQLAGPQSELATKKYQTDDPNAAQGGGLSGTSVIGKLDVDTNTLEALRPLARGPGDVAVLDALIRRGDGGRLPTYDPNTGKFTAEAIPGQEDPAAVLDRLVNTGMGTRERFTGMLVAPMMGASEQLKAGASVMGTGRSAPRQQAPAPAPQPPTNASRGTPPEAPPTQPQAPQEPPPAEPQPYRRADIPRQRAEAQIEIAEQALSALRGESGARDAREQYKARYGVGASAAPSMAPPAVGAGGAGDGFGSMFNDQNRRTGGGQNRGSGDTPLPVSPTPKKAAPQGHTLSPKAQEQAQRHEYRRQVESASEFLTDLKLSTMRSVPKQGSRTELESVVDWPARKRATARELARLRVKFGDSSLEATTFEEIAKTWEYL